MTDDELSYEVARERLTETVRKLESGGASLAETMELWQEGERLAAICQRRLDGAQAKIDAARDASRPPTNDEPPPDAEE